MKIEATSKTEYLQQVGDRAVDIEKVDQLIRECAPGLKPANAGGMYGTMLGYGLMRYKAKSSKKEMEWPLLMLGAQKNHLSLSACELVDCQNVDEKYRAELGQETCGKSCIRFKKFEDLDQDGLKKMLTELNTRYLAGEKLYGA